MEIKVRCSSVAVAPSDTSGCLVTLEVCDAEQLREDVLRGEDDGADDWPLAKRYGEVCERARKLEQELGLLHNAHLLIACESCGGAFIGNKSDSTCRGCGMVICQTCCDVWEHFEDGLHDKGDPTGEIAKLREELAKANRKLAAAEAERDDARRERDALRNRVSRVQTHSPSCWQWHLGCAMARCDTLERERDAAKAEAECHSANHDAALELLDEARRERDAHKARADAAEAHVEDAREVLESIRDAYEIGDPAFDKAVLGLIAIDQDLAQPAASPGASGGEQEAREAGDA